MDRKQFKIQEVNRNQLWEILSYPAPHGLFLAKSRYKWVAVDNSTGDTWTEEFPRKRQAVRWLRGRVEISSKSKQWTWISEAQELMVAALKQCIVLDAEEANMILGYLDCRGYSLMTDKQGMTVRHDEQYGNNHSGDIPFTVQDAIEFSQKINENLLDNEHSHDEMYLAQLREEKQVLAALMVRITAPYQLEAVC